MSYKATNWAYDLPLTGSKKFVLVALADMADEANSCYPGQQRLADMTGRSVATVRRALEALEKLGLIEREHRIGAFGHRTSDRYTLQLKVSLPESLPLKMRTGQSAHSATRPSQPLTVSIPTAHPARGTISRTTSENHQTDMTKDGQVSYLSSGSAGGLDEVSDTVLREAQAAGISDLEGALATLTSTVGDSLSVRGAIELVQAITSRAKHPVTRVDAYVATVCRNSPDEVRWDYDRLDLGEA